MMTEDKKNEISSKLSLYAMLGDAARERAKKNGVDLDSIFDACMKDAKNIEKNPIKQMQIAMFNYQLAILKTMTLENRCVFILNSIDRHEKNKDTTELNWKKINSILFESPLEYDYNICTKVNSKDEVNSLLMDIRMSYIIEGPWYKQKCKTCGDDFYLSKSEMLFFIEKELKVPKRCKNCIMESKGQESYRQRKEREEKEREKVRSNFLPDDGKTPMQKAFEKAGII